MRSLKNVIRSKLKAHKKVWFKHSSKLSIRLLEVYKKLVIRLAEVCYRVIRSFFKEIYKNSRNF